MENVYLARDFAGFYDWSYEGRTEDIPFYITMAQKYGSPLLELACGTGRLTIPLAKEGFNISGIDISEEMLSVAKTKIAGENIHLLKGDMIDFSLGRKFNLVFIPNASLFHLHTVEEKLKCLSCVYKHLADNGIAIIDLIPADKMKNQEVEKRVSIKKGINPATGRMTEELNKKLSIDGRVQCVTAEHTYLEEEPDGGIKSYKFIQKYTWVREDEMRELFNKSGFQVTGILGDYNYKLFNKVSSRMIFLATK